VAKFYLSNVSSLITFSSLGRTLKISVDSVEKYSHHLEEVFLLFFNKMFHPSLKKQEKAPRKVYSIDTGLCNAVGFRILQNLSKLMENLVAVELKKRSILNPNLEVYYWRNNLGL
jgi:hypothetical protein